MVGRQHFRCHGFSLGIWYIPRYANIFCVRQLSKIVTTPHNATIIFQMRLPKNRANWLIKGYVHEWTATG